MKIITTGVENRKVCSTLYYMSTYSVNKETKKHLITQGVPLKIENTETLSALPSVPENKGTELQRKGNEPHSWAHVTQYIPLHNLIVDRR